MLSDKSKAYFAVILTYMIIGLNPMMLRITMEVATALEILAFRLSFAFVATLIPFALGKMKLKMSVRDFRALLPVTIVYAIMLFTLQTLSLEAIESTQYGILFALSPIFAAILSSVFAKEKTNKVQIIFIIMSVSGVIFIMFMKGASLDGFNVRGVILSTLTAINFAVVAIMLRRVSGKYPLQTITFMVAACGFLVYNIVLVTYRLSTGTIGQFFAPLADWSFVLGAIYLGVGGVFGTALLQSYSLKRIESTKVVVFSNLATVVTIFAGAIFLAEPLFWYYLLGTVFIVVGVIGTNWTSNAAREKRQMRL